MDLIEIGVLAMLCEAIFETSKMVWQNGKVSVDKIGAMAIGLLIAIGTGIDIFALVDIPTKVPYVGIVLTGILLSRGANFVHDILVNISNIQQNKLNK